LLRDLDIYEKVRSPLGIDKEKKKKKNILPRQFDDRQPYN